MEAVNFQKNLVYHRTEKEVLTTDVYLPNRKTPSPVIVLIHGGAFQAGSKEMYREWGETLVKEGFAVIVPNYTLTSKSIPSFPTSVDDLYALMNWVVEKSNFWNLDIERISICGDSAGAYFAAYLALKPRPTSYRICSVIGIYGIYDFVQESEEPIDSTRESMLENFIGKPYRGNKTLFYAVSPINFIADAISVPTFDTAFLLIWGDQDKVVNPKQSILFAQELEAHNIIVKQIEIKNVGHFWFNLLPCIKGGRLSDWPNSEVYPEILDFLTTTTIQRPSGNFSKRQIEYLAKRLSK